MKKKENEEKRNLNLAKYKMKKEMIDTVIQGKYYHEEKHNNL